MPATTRRSSSSEWRTLSPSQAGGARTGLREAVEAERSERLHLEDELREREEGLRKTRDELVFDSLLHDIGKIGISERILLKPSALSPEERAVVELQPRIGYRLVHQVPTLRPHRRSHPPPPRALRRRRLPFRAPRRADTV